MEVKWDDIWTEEKVHFIHLGMRSINYIARESVLFRFFLLSRQDEICS